MHSLFARSLTLASPAAVLSLCPLLCAQGFGQAFTALVLTLVLYAPKLLFAWTGRANEKNDLRTIVRTGTTALQGAAFVFILSAAVEFSVF
jgi:VIT1/CCC1 family predicted Fe2+/Mn2+ transporter